MFLRWLERIIDRRIDQHVLWRLESTPEITVGAYGANADAFAEAKLSQYRMEDARRKQYDADTERLKALGGIERTPEQQREWIGLVGRNLHRNIRYFENRLWESEPPKPFG